MAVRAPRPGLVLLLLGVALAGGRLLARWPVAPVPAVPPRQPSWTRSAGRQPAPWPSPAEADCRAMGRCCVAVGACADLYGGGAAASMRSSACTQRDELPPAAALRGARHVAVIGDSTARRMYEALWARLLTPAPMRAPRVAGRHADHVARLPRWAPAGDRDDDLVLEFLWRPFAANVRFPSSAELSCIALCKALDSAACLGRFPQVSVALRNYTVPGAGWPDVTILSIGLWDMLHVRQLQAYRAGLQQLLDVVGRRHSGRSLWWVSAPSLQNEKLAPKKRPHMSDSLAGSYNAAALEYARTTRAEPSYSNSSESAHSE
jgi:hypothetical protein